MIDRSIAPQLFGELDDEDLAILTEVLVPRRFAKGDVAVRHGERNDSLSFVTEGVFDVTIDVAGHRLDFADLGPGSFFGSSGLVDPGPASATIDAKTDAAVLTLTREAFESRILRKNPRVASRLFFAIAREAAARVRASSAVTFAWDEDEQDFDVKTGFGALVDKPDAPPAPVSWLSKSARTATSVHEKPYADQVEDIVLALKTLEPLGHELMQRLGRHLDVRTYGPGTVIVREGDMADGLYLLLRGTVDVLCARAGDFVTVHTLEARRIFGLNAFLLEAPRSATCRARDETTVGIVGPAQMLPLLEWGERGGTQGAIAMEWIARQVVSDARLLSQRLARAFEALIARGGIS